jgi:hypothetical protein
LIILLWLAVAVVEVAVAVVAPEDTALLIVQA